MALETLFLDAGGVLVHPNWDRVSDTLARHGVRVTADALRRADPTARFAVDQGTMVAATTDAERAWPYMHGVMHHAGAGDSPGVDAALDELRAYHAEHNLWEHVPGDVVPALQRGTVDCGITGGHYVDFDRRNPLTRSGGRAETTLHVGDLYHVDVVGARRAGLQAILLDAAGLYEGYDCERVSTLDALVDSVARAQRV